jgi:phage terminase small subunit
MTKKPSSLELRGARDKTSALDRLTPKQKKFVLAYLETNASVADCARAAGYLDPYHAGYQTMRLAHVREALHEEATKRLQGSAALGTKVLVEIAEDAHHKDRLKAARELIAHAGLAPVTRQEIDVRHTSMTREEVRAKIKVIMAQIGHRDAARLLEEAGIVDAEFTEVGA